MKKIVLLIIGCTLLILGVVLVTASSPNYNSLFTISSVCSVGAASAFIKCLNIDCLSNKNVLSILGIILSFVILLYSLIGFYVTL